MTTIVNAGGGDYQGLPTQPVKYRGRRQHTGLPWGELTEQYIARGGQVDASVWHKGNVVVVGGNARSSSANLHSFVEASEYDETAASLAPMRVTRPKPAATPRPAGSTTAKLTQEQRVTVGRRYQDGESLTELAKDYGVSVTTISTTLTKVGVQRRTRIEAGKVTRERRAS